MSKNPGNGIQRQKTPVSFPVTVPMFQSAWQVSTGELLAWSTHSTLSRLVLATGHFWTHQCTECCSVLFPTVNHHSKCRSLHTQIEKWILPSRLSRSDHTASPLVRLSHVACLDFLIPSQSSLDANAIHLNCLLTGLFLKSVSLSPKDLLHQSLQMSKVMFSSSSVQPTDSTHSYFCESPHYTVPG